MEVCPLCLTDSAVSRGRKYGEYVVVYCSECQLRFSSPMRDPGWTFYRDSQNYKIRSEESDPAVGDEMASRDWRFETFFGLCESRANPRVLDVGCGEGKFLALAQSKGFEPYGIDLDPRTVQLARCLRGLQHVETGNWETLRQFDGWNNFDALTLFDVLEHVGSPAEVAATALKLLRPGGAICITVPRLDRWPRLFDAYADIPPHHLTLWTDKALRALLDKAGFQDVRIVQRPLRVEDFLLHAVWRIRRAVRGRPLAEPASQERPASARSRGRQRLSLIARKFILNSCRPADWLMESAHLGRGFTLLAYGTKPAEERNEVKMQAAV